MRVALCLSGQMRTYERCYSNLKKYILEPLRPDVFIHTWEKKGIWTQAKNFKSIKDEYVDIKKLKDLYNPKCIEIDEFAHYYTEELKGVKVPETLKQKEPKHYKGTLPMFYKIWACNQLKTDWEERHQFEYDVVIRLRPDLLLHEELPNFTLNRPDIIWHNTAHKGEYNTPYWQVSDKFVISNSKNMDYYSSVFLKLPKYWGTPLGNGNWDEYRIGERLANYHLQISNIKFQEFSSKCEILRNEVEKKPASYPKIYKNFKKLYNHIIKKI